MPIEQRLEELAELDLPSTWGQMQTEKNDLENRCEQYALWTIPYISPEDNTKQHETIRSNVAMGARVVNHLANRVVDVMFPGDRPFFSMPPTPEFKRALSAELGADSGDGQATAKALGQLSKLTNSVITDAMREFDLTSYRPIAIEAVKHAIITGGCIIRRFADNKRTVYGIKDYAVTRDTRGVLTSVCLRDIKKFSTLVPSMQNFINDYSPEKYTSDGKVTVYTYYERISEGVWAGVQSVEKHIMVDTLDTYTDVTLPVFDINWNLARDETYPRGLVEDHTVLFHNLDVTTEAVIDLIGIAADIKFLVNPGSGINIEELNRSARGTYHAGQEGDINPVEFRHRAELSVLIEQIGSWERQLAQIFLLGSGSVRDAERVTAAEIRSFTRELESAFGGLYSKLALTWQRREAEWLLQQIDIADYSEELSKDFDVVITTGTESLSREGQLDSFRLAINDLQLLDQVPEDVRGRMDISGIAEFLFDQRGLDFTRFLLTQEQLQAKQQAEQKQQQDLMAHQAAATAASRPTQG